MQVIKKKVGLGISSPACKRERRRSECKIKMKSAAFLLVLFVAAVQGQNPCDEAGVMSYVSMNLDIACSLSLFSSRPTPTTPAQMAALDASCSTTCAGALANYFRGPPCSTTGNVNYTATNALGATIFELFCQPVQGADITRCRYALDAIDPTIFNNTNLQACGGFLQLGTCPPGCADGLRGISQGIGCCYQSIYNDSNILEALSMADPDQLDVMFDERALGFFELLRNPAIWTACGVGLIDECTEPPFYTPATQAAATGLKFSTVLMAVGMVVAALS